jgi:hypothetical protein
MWKIQCFKARVRKKGRKKTNTTEFSMQIQHRNKSLEDNPNPTAQSLLGLHSGLPGFAEPHPQRHSPSSIEVPNRNERLVVSTSNVISPRPVNPTAQSLSGHYPDLVVFAAAYPDWHSFSSTEIPNIDERLGGPNNNSDVISPRPIDPTVQSLSGQHPDFLAFAATYPGWYIPPGFEERVAVTAGCG